MVQIYYTYDTQYNTWNAMNMNNICLFYGNAFELDKWVIKNKDKYYE